MSIPFTQYLRPDGRKKSVVIDMDSSTEAKADAIIEAGYVFEIEELNTGEISATIADPRTDTDVAHARIVPNGPDVPVVIEMMIMDFRL